MFISGQGRFPGVIDIAGIGSGSYEYRAALLASRGFVTLALPFFLYADLPKRLADVELEYFMVSILLYGFHLMQCVHIDMMCYELKKTYEPCVPNL